jgi:hypothetical protein
MQVPQATCQVDMFLCFCSVVDLLAETEYLQGKSFMIAVA